MDDETRERIEALEREVSRLRQLLAGPPAPPPATRTAANGDSGPFYPVGPVGNRVWVKAGEDPAQLRAETLALLAKNGFTTDGAAGPPGPPPDRPAAG